jgi:hypothetical protein
MNAPRLTDPQISQALRAHLPDRAQAGLRERILEATETTRQQRALPSFLGALSEADPATRGRSLLIAAALLVALALAATAAVGALRLLERDPFKDLSLEPPTAPSPAATTLPGPSAEPSNPPVAAGYQALVLRFEGDAAVIVAVRADRQERVIASIPVKPRSGDLVTSEDGWLARANGAKSDFIDLRDPAHAPRPFSMGETTTGYSWNPDGRFAFWNETGLVTLIDPETGGATQRTVRGPLQDVVGWTADGSALLAYGEAGDSIYGGGERVTDPAWRVIRLDGGPDETTVPDLDLGLVRGASYGQRGARLQLCERGSGESTNGDTGHYDCPDELMGAVVGDAPGASVTTWYGSELAPDDVDDASFGGDGTAMWLLLDRRVGGRQFALARVDTPGTARVVAAAGLPAAGYDPFSIVAVAPDDSLVAVNASGLVLVEPNAGRSTAIDGRLLGFVSSATADTWAGEPFQPVEPIVALKPVLPGYPALPPIDEFLVANQLAPGDRELWRQEYVAVDGSAGTATTTEIGPLAFKTGFGLVLVCSGPSDVLVTMNPDTPFMPRRGRCDNGEATGGQIPSFRINASARFVVTANTDTSWQLVIFDPAPE